MSEKEPVVHAIHAMDPLTAAVVVVAYLTAIFGLSWMADQNDKMSLSGD